MDAGWTVAQDEVSRTAAALGTAPAADPAPASRPLPASDAGPGPFRRLLGESAWRELPQPVQQRFERVLAPGESAGFVGEIATTRLTAFGRLTARLARIAGAPLPLRALERTAAAVLVTENHVAGAQAWTRIYDQPGRLPQVIRSMKRFAGPTGLEECVGAGFGMALTAHVERRALVIRSAGYFWRVAAVGSASRTG
jgi:hypothetical protein